MKFPINAQLPPGLSQLGVQKRHRGSTKAMVL